MFGVFAYRTWSRCVPAAAAVAAGGLLLAGCSSAPRFSTPSFSSLFGSKPAPAAAEAQAAVPPTTEIECPGVSVREGASTLAISANPAQPSAMTLRYQVGIGQTARECRLASGVVTLRVGVQGRVILGPAGGAGQLDVPLRYAVVHEGPDPKTIVTKLERVNVVIPPGETHVQFTHVEENLTFPMPVKAGDIDSYIIYVGFDPLGMREIPKKKPPRRPPSKKPPAKKPPLQPRPN